MADDAEQDVIERAAAEWLTRLNNRAVSTETLEQFYAWRRDPAHAAAFGRIEYLWDRAAVLDGDRDIAQAVQEVLQRPRRASGFGWLPGRRAVLAGGIGLVGAAGVGWWLSGERFATGHGEQRTVALDDGSRVAINTDSEIEVRFDRSRRQVRLLRGEAWFDVAHDAARPFSVEAEAMTVTALGTSFSVRRTDDRQRVVLSEGVVTVAGGAQAPTLRLSPGMALSMRHGVAGQPEKVDLAAEMAWRSGQLIFKDMPLDAAVTEINRYARTPIQLAAPRFAGVPVNGTFRSGDTETFITAVTAIFPIEARPAGDAILLSEH